MMIETIAKPQLWLPGINRGHQLARGLIGDWPLWEGTGQGVMDVASGNGSLDGTVTGATWVGSQYGYALEFDGASNHRVTGSGASWFPYASDMTVSCLVRFDTIAKEKICWSWGIDNGYGSNEIELNTNSSDGGVQFMWNTEATARVTIPLAADTWGHVVCQRQGTNIQAWLDGQSVGTDAGAGNLFYTTHSLLLGGPVTDTRHFDGQVSLFAVWDRYLTPTEIAGLYADPFARLRRRSSAAVLSAAAGAPSGAISGNATVTFTAAGTVKGTGSLSGSATTTFTAAGTIGGTGSLSGAATVSFTVAATISATASISGSTTVTFTAAGTIRDLSGAIEGSATVTFTVAATIRKRITGPYTIAAGQAYVTGQAAGQAFDTGAAAGQTYLTGAAAAQAA